MNLSQRLSGYELIHSYLKTLDSSSGVYRMLDDQKRVLYVGKARNLKNRVSNYSRYSPNHSSRITRMISETRSMMFLTTITETEALLLEQNLIKQLKPKYNVLLRDDKSFPYIFMSNEHEFPRLEKHRGAKNKTGRYYGPFASAGAVNRTLNTLQKVFLLRSCSDKEVEAGDRPCLNYHLKRCSGPCGRKINKEDYKLLVNAADDFLTGKSNKVQETLSLQMKQASEKMEFELAASLRDRIRALAQVQSNQGINPRTVSEADVISLHLDAGQACVQVFFIRANQNWGNVDFYPRVSSDMSHDEVLEAFMGQFYSTKDPARLIILSHDMENLNLMKDLLSKKLGRKVEIAIPQRGERFDLMVSALRNAKESLARKLANTVSQQKLLNGLAAAFSMATPPKRIEVYDNSHIQGEFAVGAMIASGPEGFMKNSYRKFNIIGENLTRGDDFGMMREVLARRFKRLLKEDPYRKEEQWPDLLLIDGGAGHVTAVSQIMKDFGIEDIAMVGVAKGVDRNHGKEEFHIAGRRPFALRKNDPVLYFVQRLRDEAHRFAIGTHRAKRSKAISASPLDEIPGVVSSRKRSLLLHFGSAKGVKRAHLSDLKSVDGISSALAERIYNYFNES